MNVEIINIIKYLLSILFLYLITYFFCYLWSCIFFEGLVGVDNQIISLINNISSSYFRDILYMIFLKLIYVILAGIISFFVIFTKNTLDKNQSKYLVYFFDNFIYPTIILAAFILCKKYFDNNIFYSLFLFFYIPTYILGFLRKFIKPLYKHIWPLIILLWILLFFTI